SAHSASTGHHRAPAPTRSVTETADASDPPVTSDGSRVSVSRLIRCRERRGRGPQSGWHAFKHARHRPIPCVNGVSALSGERDMPSEHAPQHLVYIARQPILDGAGQVFGYELLYRAREED